MKNASVTLAVYTLSNETVGASIDTKEFESYVKELNKYQKTPITYYKEEKKYSHVKNNELLGAIKDYFKDQTTIIFNKEINIHNISDIELQILKEKPSLKTQGFKHEKALKFLEDNNLLDIFLEGKLEKNITSYYNEYSRDFSERINIQNTKEIITDLQEIDNYLSNSILADIHKVERVYHYTKKIKVVSFSYDKYHTYLDDNANWVKDLFEQNKHKNNGFPYAQGKVIENSFLELYKTLNKNNNKKNSLF